MALLMWYTSKNGTQFFMGITDFSFLQAYVAWNLSLAEMNANSRGGEIKQNQSAKW